MADRVAAPGGWSRAGVVAAAATPPHGLRARAADPTVDLERHRIEASGPLGEGSDRPPEPFGSPHLTLWHLFLTPRS